MSDFNFNASASIDPSTPFCPRTYFHGLREAGCNPLVRGAVSIGLSGSLRRVSSASGLHSTTRTAQFGSNMHAPRGQSGLRMTTLFYSAPFSSAPTMPQQPAPAQVGAGHLLSQAQVTKCYKSVAVSVLCRICSEATVYKMTRASASAGEVKQSSLFSGARSCPFPPTTTAACSHPSRRRLGLRLLKIISAPSLARAQSNTSMSGLARSGPGGASPRPI